jgi:hypothetical protein
MIEIVRSASTVSDRKAGRTGAAAGTADALDVIEWLRRDVPQKNRVEIAKIDAEFEGSRATEHVNPAFLEVALNLPAAFRGELSRMLLDDELPAEVSLVKSPIVVVGHVPACDRNETTVASAPGANVLKRDGFDSIACIASVNWFVLRDRSHPPPNGVQPATVIDPPQELIFRRLGIAKTDEMLPDRTKCLLRDVERSIPLISFPCDELREKLDAPPLATVPTHDVRLPAWRSQSDDTL